MDKVNELAQEVSSYGQAYRSYAALLENPSYSVNRKKLIEIMNKCGKHCKEISRLLKTEEVQSNVDMGSEVAGRV